MYAWILIISFTISLAVIPVLNRIALKTGVVDQPDHRLKIHQNAVPYLGGIGILAGFMVPLILAAYQVQFEKELIAPIVVGTLSITLLGLLDDIFDIKQNPKFAIQILIGLFAAIFGPRIGTIPSTYFAIFLSIFYIIGSCNALNLLDGLDGLASGCTAISAIFFSILFLIRGDITGAVLSGCLLGACLAFLIYNFEPAKVFMGDAGSMLLGFVLAMLMIRYSCKPYDIIGFVTPILICAVPIFDTFMTYLRRFLNHKPIFPGDRSHFYDQLVDKGLSIKQTVFISYAIGGIFGLIAIVINFVPSVVSILILAALLFTLLFFVVKMRMLKMEH